MNKEILVAANTPNGFYSFFDKYLDRDRVICLKGGSGVGKSTLLKEVIKRAEAKNYSILRVPCSSDYKSLDMVIVKELDLAILDSTSPHIVEPTAYGLIGEIFNMGEFLDIKKLRTNRDTLLNLFQYKTLMYSCLYNHLGAATKHLDNIDMFYSTYYDRVQINAKAQEIITNHCDKAVGVGDDISCFASYLDVNGIVDNTAKMVGSRVVIKIETPSTALARAVLEIIRRRLVADGVRFEPYHAILAPDMLDSIGLKNIFITTAPIDADWTYSLDSEASLAKVRTNLIQIIDERGAVNSEIARASERLAVARNLHVEIEKYYYDAMDFSRLEEAKELLITDIFR